MTDTVETLRTELDALKADFEEFKAYAMPVIEGHKPSPVSLPPSPSLPGGFSFPRPPSNGT